MLLGSLVVAGFGAVAPCQAAKEVVARDWLVIAPVDARARRPFNPSATFARYLLDPSSAPPKEGDKLTGELGKEQAWMKRASDENGSVGGDPIQMAFTTIEWPEEGIALADLDGAGTVWVGGVPQVGDVYGDGMGGLPVAMKKGANLVYVTGIRGGFRLAFTRPEAGLLVNPFDATVPDLVAGESSQPIVGLLVVNATDQALPALTIETGSPDASAPFERTRGTEGPGIPPRGVLKFAVSCLPRELPVFEKPGGRVVAPITVSAGGLVAHTELAFDIKGPEALRRQTYLSDVDGSVQSFAVLPPVGGRASALVLTLHGAGVDAMGQAAAYSPKPDFWIVAPTNRRRFGFDWQDWGRRDAYDVLDAAMSSFDVDPRRVYLTGHSMGGHGTWHLAANDPSTFAAIAPSAGWSGFDSYGGARPKSARSELWDGADGASRTLALIDNLKQIPTFVLHGTADDNVPISEAKRMLDALAKAGAKPESHFQEGAGHWWDGDAAPGADCVDWPGIFDFFRAHVRPALATHVLFSGADPSVRSSCDWVEVVELSKYGEPFSVEGTWDPAKSSGSVSTHNVQALVLSVPDGTVHSKWKVDGDAVEGDPEPAASDPEGSAPVRYRRDVALVRRGGHWKPATEGTDPPSWTPIRKEAYDDSPVASGPFKRAFDNGFLLVFGTKGSEAESLAQRERARYDATHWWYRANGHALTMSDRQFLAHDHGGESFGGLFTPGVFNVILYGNRDTNAAWEALVAADAPFDAKRGQLRLGKKTFDGEALAACVILPSAGCKLVGCFADTGPRGSRLGYTLAPFISGVGYPDYTLFSSDVLTQGDSAVLAAGYFDAGWNLGD